MTSILEIFKFVPVDNGTNDMSLKWGQRIVQKWSQSNAFARDGIGDEEASELAAYLGGFRDCIISRDWEHYEKGIAEMFTKLSRRSSRSEKVHPAGILFKSIVDYWIDQFDLIGKVSNRDLGDLFRIVRPLIEQL
jgi:hypothetical protein